MSELMQAHVIGEARPRVDGHAKVTGMAPYAYEHEVERPLYLYPVQATIARGRITAIDTQSALAMPGIVAVLTHLNAPRLTSDDDRELWVLQDDIVHFRGQFITAVVAESLEMAREAAARVGVIYAEEPHDSALKANRSDFYAPETVNPDYATDSIIGDVDQAIRSAAVIVDQTYTTPWENNNPMETHTAVAEWRDGGLLMYDSTQGATSLARMMGALFGIDPKRVRIIAPYVGGGFGSKGTAHAHDVLVALAAKAVGGRPVKFALTRQQMFCLAGYRTPTIQHVRLGADRKSNLTAISQEVIEQTSRFKEFAEQTALPARMMYAAPNRRTTHRLAALDVPVPSWMRAPGECPGMFGPEVAMDELAVGCGIDPIELRIRNEPKKHPEDGLPWSGRRLIECFTEGARRFGWERRDPRPRARLEEGWLIGMGVAASTYPVHVIPGSRASIRYGKDQKYAVRIAAMDIGTGTSTALAQIAADALNCPFEAVKLEIGDSALPPGTVEGGSSGITCWGSAIVAAARAFRDRHGGAPSPGDEVSADMPENPDLKKFALHSFGAQFAEVRVHADTGEIRVARMLGVFSAGSIINPRLARSQFLGGMTMALSMALHEQSVLDPRFGHIVTHDLAEYHIAANADIEEMEAVWLEESDPHANPMGSRGIGEIGIVGGAAAIANAAWHATGIRVRDLPITADRFLR